MAVISTGQGIIGLMPGATWGTAVQCTGAQALHGILTLKNARGEFKSRDVGFGNFVTEIVKLEESVDVTLTADLSYDSLILQPLMELFGTDTKTTVDCPHTVWSHAISLDEENDGEFSTVAWAYGTGTNDVLEIPSVKWHTMRITHERNNVGTVTVDGIGDRVVTTSAVNAYADLDGLTYQGYEAAVLGGTNHYCRINAASGDALDAADDMEIMSYEITLTRPLDRDWVLRGANTKYTMEPKQLGQTTGTLTIALHEIDAASIDLLSLWLNSTAQKAEIFFDGSVIGGAHPYSYKFQFPALEHQGAFPAGFDYPNNNSRMRPTAVFNLLQASAAPTGMVGVTNYLTITAHNTRSTAYG